MLRFVVLQHSGFGDPHFDLMFETSPGSPLATWRCDQWPFGEQPNLEPLGDHRRAYLDYEGPVSGNRGTVRRVESGTHVVIENGPEQLVVELEDGRKITLPRA